MTGKQTTLAELLEDGLFVDGDWVETKDQDPLGEVRLIQLADVGDGVFRNKSRRFLTAGKAKELKCTFLEPGDVLIARMPEPLGRACIFPGVDQPAVTAVDVCILRPNPSTVNANWLANAINSPDFRNSMQQYVRGTTRQRISRKNLGALSLAIPVSLAEQVQLAEIVEATNIKRNSALSHAETAARGVKRLRQAILAAACSGKLTVHWRDSHPNAQSVTQALAGLKPPKRRRKLENVPPELALPELPNYYVVATIGDAASLIEYGTSQAINLDSENRVPVLRMGNIQDGRLDLTSLKYHVLDDEIEKLLLNDGDLLFNRTNSPELVGKSAVYHDEKPMSFASYLIRVRFAADVCDSDFANYWLNSAWGRAWARLVKTDGVSQSNINGTKLAAMPLPLPPIEEQREIVRRASSLLSTADALLARIDDGLRAVECTSLAILAKASRGELSADSTLEQRQFLDHEECDSAHGTVTRLPFVTWTASGDRVN